MIKKGEFTRDEQRAKRKLQRASRETAAARRQESERKGLDDWINLVGWKVPEMK